MKNNIFTILITISLFFALLHAEDMSQWLRPEQVPQPKENQLTKERVALGKLLYFDVRVSADNSISCATCHHPKRGWSDENPTAKAIGFEGREGPRNSPTILNSAYQKHQFWDGRVKSLEAQALGPVQTAVEMNMPLDKLLKKLQAIKGYKELFEKAYPNQGITAATFAKAIASFERTIVSSDAPFDRYAKGDTEAISQEAKEGFELFKGKAHCIYCHDGWNFSDGSFQNIGLNRGELKGKELGRYNVTKRAVLYGAFKTPTLRDVTKSEPYFHDGSVKTLEEATRICSSGGRYKEGVQNLSTAMSDRNLSKEEIDKIVSFMKTLSGPDIVLEIPTHFPQ